MLSTKLGNEVLYCFFEGNEDSCYYISRINHFFPKSEPIICFGKKNVIGIFTKLNNGNFSQFKKAFFIDRDFDSPTNIEGIFETSTYSIENYYCNRDTFSDIIKHEFKIESINNDYTECLRIFDKFFNEHNEAILELNATYYAIKNNNEGIKLNINSCIPKEYLDYDFPNSIKKNYSITEILKNPKIHRIPSEYDINQCKSILKNDLQKKLRGKFQLTFLKKLLRYLISDANGRYKDISKKVSLSFQDDLFLSQFSQYANTERELYDYLKAI